MSTKDEPPRDLPLVGDGQHSVEPGDCFSSIAAEHGLAIETLWTHPKNRAFSKERDTPHVLQPGDRVFVPERTLRYEELPLEVITKFVRQGAREILLLRFFDAQGDAWAGLQYRLEIDERSHEGTSDEEGRVEVPVPSRARRATLRITLPVPDVPDAELIPVRFLERRFDVHLGHLEPIGTRRGAAQRLLNLGLMPRGDASDRSFARGLRAHRASEGESVSGEYDDLARSSLRRIYQH